VCCGNDPGASNNTASTYVLVWQLKTALPRPRVWIRYRVSDNTRRQWSSSTFYRRRRIYNTANTRCVNKTAPLWKVHFAIIVYCLDIVKVCWKTWQVFYCKFLAESSGERIVKIGQPMEKLWAEISLFFLLTMHTQDYSVSFLSKYSTTCNILDMLVWMCILATTQWCSSYWSTVHYVVCLFVCLTETKQHIYI